MKQEVRSVRRTPVRKHTGGYKKRQQRSRGWRGKDVVKTGLKSTLCFDEGSPLIVDIKLIIIRLCIALVLPPNAGNALVGDGSSVQAEAH